jgi:hypothetical protein
MPRVSVGEDAQPAPLSMAMVEEAVRRMNNAHNVRFVQLLKATKEEAERTEARHREVLEQLKVPEARDLSGGNRLSDEEESDDEDDKAVLVK